MHAPLGFVIINLFSAGMRMPDPLPTFAEVVKRIRVGYPDFAYLHVLEPTTTHHTQTKTDGEVETGKESNKLLRDIWGDGAYITNSDYGRDSAIEVVEKEGGLVSFARHFVSNVSKRFLLLSLSTRRNADLSYLTA
jgi:NADPH2 dehydrogenase